MEVAQFTNELDVLYLAGGCFWCTEALFEQVNGVVSVIPGYMGGTAETAHYKAVSTGTTQHAECVEIKYNSDVVSLETLLELFFATHDPTTLNVQGNDVGPQYRSAIFYTQLDQFYTAKAYMEQLQVQAVFSTPIVTTLEQASTFYAAELDHHNYYKRNALQPYCYYVVRPKMEKVQQIYSHFLAKQ